MVPFKSTEGYKNTKLEREELAKQLVIRKAIVPNGRKFRNIFDKQFDTIVYCIVDTVCTVLAGIDLVISEAACYLEKDPSLMLLVKIIW